MSTVEDIDFPPPEAAVPPPPSLATPAKRKKQQKRRSADADYDEAARTAPPTDAAAAAPVKATEASADDAGARTTAGAARGTARAKGWFVAVLLALAWIFLKDIFSLTRPARWVTEKTIVLLTGVARAILARLRGWLPGARDDL
jgi:hypothetical protein